MGGGFCSESPPNWSPSRLTSLGEGVRFLPLPAFFGPTSCGATRFAAARLVPIMLIAPGNMFSHFSPHFIAKHRRRGLPHAPLMYPHRLCALCTLVSHRLCSTCPLVTFTFICFWRYATHVVCPRAPNIVPHHYVRHITLRTVIELLFDLFNIYLISLAVLASMSVY